MPQQGAGAAAGAPKQIDGVDVLRASNGEGINAARVADFAALAAFSAAISVVRPDKAAPAILRARACLPPEAHIRQDAARRTLFAVYEGHSGRSADVLAGMKQLIRESRVGQQDGPPLLALVEDGQLFRSLMALKRENEQLLERVLLVPGATHARWAMVDGSMKRWFGFVYHPILLALGKEKPSDAQRVYYNKDHRGNDDKVTAIADGALRAIVEAYLETPEGRLEVAALLEAPEFTAETSGMQVSEAMRGFFDRVKAWAARTFQDDPTNAALAAFALDEGLTLMANLFAIRNQLAELFVSSMACMQPFLQGTRKHTYQDIVATFLIDLAKLDETLVPLAYAALFETATGNPHHADGTDGSQEGVIAQIKFAEHTSGRGAHNTRRTEEHVLKSVALGQAVAGEKERVLQHGKQRARKYANAEASMTVRLERDAHLVHLRFRERGVFQPTGRDTIFNILGDGQAYPEGAKLAQSFLLWRHEGQASLNAYLAARIAGEPIALTNQLRPVFPTNVVKAQKGERTSSKDKDNSGPYVKE